MTVRNDRLTGADGPDDEFLDVIVVGGSQAGLAMAWHLARHHLRFVVLEAAPEIGHAWRSRWDSLTLFTPTQYDALPGMRFPGPPDTYPTKDPVASYLKAYAAAFNLPVRLERPGHPRLGSARLRPRRCRVPGRAHHRPRPRPARRLCPAPPPRGLPEPSGSTTDRRRNLPRAGITRSEDGGVRHDTADAGRTEKIAVTRQRLVHRNIGRLSWLSVQPPQDKIMPAIKFQLTGLI